MTAPFLVPATRYPAAATGLAVAADAAPVVIDGMTVRFDERVPLYPVTLQPPADGDGDVGS